MNVTMIFPGQGCQKVGMGQDFYESDSLAKEMLERASHRLDLDFTKLLFEENDKLEQTEFTQPAVFLVSLIAYSLFKREFSKKPFRAFGHSLGEFSALSAVGALDYLDGVELVHKRGLLMKSTCEGLNAGMMALLGLSDDDVERVVDEARREGKKVWAANYNCDGQIVIAGNRDDLASLEKIFRDAGAKRALLLNMSVASHCELLSGATKTLGEYLEKYLKNSFDSPVISNVTSKEYSTKKDALDLLSKQLIYPVKYKHSVQYVDNQSDIYIEFGATVLKGLNRRITKKPTHSITDMASLQKVLSELS